MYIHLVLFLDMVRREEDLLPELIVNEKRVGKDRVVQLEGAVGSVVLKIPGVKLFNVIAKNRLQEFAPVKTMEDVNFLYRSGRFRFDPATATLQCS